ncbi:uncharacterized protein LOC100876072 isoform X2 [Megachile rotundata]|uniref:uncharacterized protein LOC100876072 isoform X2 n=1 Tax=Megachile rotundata TaxID=143995 RepID=UPI003FD5DAC8
MQKSGKDSEYERHVNLSIQWNRWLLKPIGIWPHSDMSRTKKLYDWLTYVVCYGLISFLFVPCSMYVFLEVEDLYNKIKLFGPLIFFLMAFAKYYLLIYHGNDIRECIERIKWDWKNITYHDDKNIMLENANFGRRLVTVCTFFMYSGFASYYIIIPITIGKVKSEDGNLTFIPLAFPFSSLIVDTRYSPTNEIIFSVQLIAGALMHGITSAACGLGAMLAVHACGQMQVLMNWLKHLNDGRSDMGESVDDRIACIVSQHVRILKYLTHTERTLQLISFAEFLGCTVDICLLGYYVIMCKKIGEMTYMTEWYRLPGNKKLCCIMIIAMSNSSMKLTAGSMVELSIETFTNVVKTAFAFLNVLRTMT